MFNYIVVLEVWVDNGYAKLCLPGDKQDDYGVLELYDNQAFVITTEAPCTEDDVYKVIEAAAKALYKELGTDSSSYIGTPEDIMAKTTYTQGAFPCTICDCYIISINREYILNKIYKEELRQRAR